MLNQIVLVGRIAKELKIEELKSGKKMLKLTIAVPRSFKNANGEYETDFIDCVLWNNIAENTKNYCQKGDIVGVKGRLETDMILDRDGEIIGKSINVIAERVTFLSSKKEEEK